MLTQTIWQTLNMPIRGETNYSAVELSFMISLSFGARKVVIVIVQGVWEAAQLHKAKLSFDF